jgi:hypothetical protein
MPVVEDRMPGPVGRLRAVNQHRDRLLRPNAVSGVTTHRLVFVDQQCSTKKQSLQKQHDDDWIIMATTTAAKIDNDDDDDHNMNDHNNL